jgi:nitrite reductase (NO-forming)
MSNSTLIVIIVVLVIVLLLYLFIAGYYQPSLPDGAATSSEPTTTTGAILNQLGSNTPTGTAPQTRVIDLAAKNFAFNPNLITVNSGDTVELRINSDGRHNFVLNELGIVQDTPPGQTVIRFTPEKKGAFLFYCSVPGHRERGMEGQLIVK